MISIQLAPTSFDSFLFALLAVFAAICVRVNPGESRRLWRTEFFQAGRRFQPSNRLSSRQALCPPKPKLLDSATSIFAWRGSFGM